MCFTYGIVMLSKVDHVLTASLFCVLFSRQQEYPPIVWQQTVIFYDREGRNVYVTDKRKFTKFLLRRKL